MQQLLLSGNPEPRGIKYPSTAVKQTPDHGRSRDFYFLSYWARCGWVRRKSIRFREGERKRLTWNSRWYKNTYISDMAIRRATRCQRSNNTYTIEKWYCSHGQSESHRVLMRSTLTHLLIRSQMFLSHIGARRNQMSYRSSKLDGKVWPSA